MIFQNRWHRALGCFLLMAVVVFPTGSWAATLHAIIAADTDDRSIGESVKIDLNKLQSLMQNISRHTGLTLNSRYISGGQLTRNSVLSAVNGISVAPDDVVFFFYNGHGFNPSQPGQGEREKWPAMSLEGGSLKLTEVRTALTGKNPRLLITIADTCNVFMGRADLPEIRGNEKPENYRKLFLEPRGKITASGSKPGQYSWGSSQLGGFYTNAFLNSLSTELATNGTPDWNKLMERANAPINAGGTVQEPQSKVEMEGGAPPPPPPVGDQCLSGPCTNTPAEGASGTCVGPYYKKGNQECCKSSGGGEECWSDD